MFGDGDSVLARYATRFDCAEINSSFYRSHRRQTYERWAGSVPAAFRFTVKLPREITHDSALRGCGPLLSRFLDEVSGLGSRLGGLLVQLPASHAYDARVAATFFAMLRRRHAGPVAIEPRQRGWFSDAAEAMLLRHDIARVAADPALLPDAAQPGGARRWRYWRWHGSPRMYYSGYDDAALQRFADDVLACKPAAPQFCIFDNTAHGHAASDALRFRALLDGAGTR